MTIFKNIKDPPYSAVGDGVADDSAAFLAFQVDGQAAGSTPVQLTIPAGTYNNPTASNFMQGIQDITIIATGATVNYLILGGPLSDRDPDRSSRLLAFSAGDDRIVLKTPSEVSRFSIGEMVCISCSPEMQGTSGYPPNVTGLYRRISSISGAQLILDTPLTLGGKATYPAIFTPGGYDAGGPATVFKLIGHSPQTTALWDQKVTIIGGTWDAPGVNGEVQMNAREWYMTGSTIKGQGASNGAAPSVSKTMIFDTCTFTNGWEIDKLIESIKFVNCANTAHQMETQSASVTNAEYTSGFYHNINCTGARTLVMNNSSLDSVTLGSGGFGNNISATFNACAIRAISLSLTRNYIDLTNPAIEYIGNGIFRTAQVGGAHDAFYSFAVPGQEGFFSGINGGGPTNFGNPFVITNVWEDVTYVYFSISYSGATLPVYSGSSPAVAITKLTLHPAQSITVNSCTGGVPAIDDLNQAPAGGRLFEYTNRSYSGNIGTTQPAIDLWGKPVFIKVNVRNPFNGTGALSLKLGGPFGTSLFTNNVWSQWDSSIDLRTPGERTIKIGSVTGNGGADSITGLSEGAWIPQGLQVWVGTDISGNLGSPQVLVTVEAKTDQSPILHSCPLSFRMRS